MAYLLDDDWDNDPRVSRAGTAAFGLYSRCGMWVARHLTDGHVPREIATAYGTTEWVAKLVAVGLWQQTEDGYQMPDYLDRNPSRDKVERRRKQYTERQERWRLRTSQVQTRDKRITNASGNASPSPLSKERRGRTPATPGAARAPTPPPEPSPTVDLDDPHERAQRDHDIRVAAEAATRQRQADTDQAHRRAAETRAQLAARGLPPSRRTP